MSALRGPRGLVLLVLLAFDAGVSVAAATEPQATSMALRAARLESVPPAVGAGRFRLRAQLQPAPAPALTGQTRGLKLSAALATKATTASCPVPGTVFSDGFESP